MTFRPSKKDIIALSFYNGQDDLDNSRITDNAAFAGVQIGRGGGNANFDFQNNNTDITQWGNWGASLKYARKWSDRLYTNANVSYSNYFSERDRRIHALTINRDLTQYGTYQIIVYRVNPEYAALYDTSGSSSVTISQPPNNIANGLGVFTGISSDTVYLEVVKI